MLRTGEFLVAILLVTTAGLVCRAVGAAPPQDNSQDWAQVKPVSPSELTRGSPVQITVEVEYNLVTLDSGLLYLYLAQSVGGCSGSDHRLLYPEVEIPIQRGRHKIKTCLLYTSPSPRDYAASRMPSSA